MCGIEVKYIVPDNSGAAIMIGEGYDERREEG
jgi:hypothetical protein